MTAYVDAARRAELLTSSDPDINARIECDHNPGCGCEDPGNDAEACWRETCNQLRMPAYDGERCACPCHP